MLNSLSSNYLSLEKTGGLFDIDATLPVLIIQFFLLVFLLKTILFEPLQSILKTRNEIIQTNLKKARVILEDVNKIDAKTKKIIQVANKKNLIEIQQIKSKLENINLLLKQNYEKQSQQFFKEKLMSYYSNPIKNYDWALKVNSKLTKYISTRPNVITNNK
jgi:ribosomal protein L24